MDASILLKEFIKLRDSLASVRDSTGELVGYIDKIDANNYQEAISEIKKGKIVFETVWKDMDDAVSMIDTLSQLIDGMQSDEKEQPN